MKKIIYIGGLISLLTLAGINQIHALPAIQKSAIATITENISSSGGIYNYTYTLNNTDPSAIWWWGIWFTSDPVAVNESNNRANWVYNGNGPGAQYEFVLESGPSGEAGLLWTWDLQFSGDSGGWTTITSPNQISSGDTNVFSFQSNILFPGPKNFFYDTINYWDSMASVEAVGQTSSSAAVPEPATMLLLGSGLISLAGYGRKKFFKK
jgi:hypothetical protein